MTPPASDDPTLEAFTQAGGRMIIYHGVSDPVFSFLATADWHGRLLDNNPDAAEALRLYAIPGMPHGAGGNAPHEVDLLGTLISWVEEEETPEAVVARFSADHAEVAAENAGAERPLCPWPSHATYVEGVADLAESFACE